MANSNDLLTLVLPLKGRAEFTFRIMEYLDKSRFPFKLIIADGSGTETVSDTLSFAENFPNIDYTYIKYPFDESYSHYYRKMVSALSDVRTPYVSLIDNDCFPVVEGLHESLAFLESHNGYSTCRGQHIDFKLNPFANSEGDLLHGSTISINPVYFDRKHTIWNSFESDSPLERISEWSHCMNIMHYNVYRTNTLAEAWKFISANNCCDIFFCEIVLALNALARGKSKVIDIPFIVRQQNSPDSVSKDMIERMDILDRMFVEKWTRDINQLMNDVAIKVSEAGDCSKSEAFSQVRQALKNHYADRLFSYLERRELAKRNIDDKSIGVSQDKPISCAAENITISQAKEVHSSLRAIISFLTKDEAELSGVY
jgi:glycosyltransferase domain-containing protein